MEPAVAVMTKVPGVVPVKSRLHPLLGPERATALYRCFLLDRLDALAALDGVAGVVAYTPPRAASVLAALAPPSLRRLPQRGADLGERMATLLERLLADGHPAALALGADSPTLPMAWVAEAARTLAGEPPIWHSGRPRTGATISSVSARRAGRSSATCRGPRTTSRA